LALPTLLRLGRLAALALRLGRRLALLPLAGTGLGSGPALRRLLAGAGGIGRRGEGDGRREGEGKQGQAKQPGHVAKS
jgi:hypothetical protein